MSLTPARYNFTIYQGATFRKRITILTGDVGSPARDLTNYTSSCVIKDKPSGTTLLTLTSGGGTIILGGAAGTLDLLITAATTTGLAWVNGTYELTITAPSAGDTDVVLIGGFAVVQF